MTQNIIGQVLLNQFRVDNFVASGGMGAVYQVWDLKRNVPLAMKVLHAEMATDPSIFKRFQREATALQNLAHPNIVPFYGIYQTPDFNFLLERYVDGPTLADLLHQRQGQPLSVGETLIYLKVLRAALGYAHANGVVHCDIKPSNVMVDRGGNIYLTDFGIMRYAETATTTMATVGTPAYMAPEQIRGAVVSAATDIYALGVMLFEMLTGQRPFRGDEVGTEGGGTTNQRIIYAHMMVPPPDPRRYNPSIPEGLAAVILRALVKEPNGRFASVQDLFMAFCTAAGMRPEAIHDRVRVSTGTTTEVSLATSIAEQPAGTYRAPVYTTPAVTGQPMVIPPQTQGPARRNWLPWLVGGAGLLLVGAVAVLILVVVLMMNGGKKGAEVAQEKTARPTSTAREIPTSAVTPTLDSQFVSTAAAQTVQAQITQVAAQATRAAQTAQAQLTRDTAQFTVTPAPTRTRTPVPPTHTPTPPLRTGPIRLAYVKGAVGDTDIYMADASGQGQTALAEGDCDEAEPSWSPDGTSIVYQANCKGTYDLWVVSSYGGSSYQLTNMTSYDEREPDWSPEGTLVVFRVNDAGTQRNEDGAIWTINVNDRQTRSLGLMGRGMTWSPDGRQFAYMSNKSGVWQIYIYDIQSGSSKQVTNCTVNCRWPAWSPDGKYLAYNTTSSASSTSPDGIWYSSVSGGSPTAIITGGGFGRPSWSADGWVAFNSDAGIEVIHPDGGSRQALIPGGNEAWAPHWSR